MSLVKREHRPGWPLESLWSQELVDGMFSDLLRNFAGAEGALERTVEKGAHLVRVEEFLEDGTCVIRAEIPGIDPETDVDLHVTDGVLHLSAERRERSEENRPDAYRSEFRYGRMARSIRLPEGTSEADVTASYKDGILEVRMPAPKEPVEPTPTKIPIAHN